MVDRRPALQVRTVTPRKLMPPQAVTLSHRTLEHRTLSHRAVPHCTVPLLASPRLTGRVLAALALALAVLMAGAPMGLAKSNANQIGGSLKQSKLYVEPEYQGDLTASEAQNLRQQLQSASTPIFIALLSEETVRGLGGIDASVEAVARGTGSSGTYLTADSSKFRTNSTEFAVDDLAAAATADASGVYDTLSRYISLVNDRARQQSGAGGIPWFLIFMLFGLGGVAFMIWRGYRKTQAIERQKIEDLKKVLEEDITVLGEQTVAVDQNDARLGDAGVRDLNTALDAYSKARAAWDQMTTEAGAQAVTSALDDGRYAMSCVNARINGESIPERLPPCFFDPRHGTSVGYVSWAPPASVARNTPACKACSATVRAGLQPNPRLVPNAGPGAAEVPYWQGGKTYGGYAGGYYQSYGKELLQQIIVGTMMGQSMGRPRVIYTTGPGMGSVFGASMGGGYRGGSSGGSSRGPSGGSGGSRGGSSGGGGFGGFKGGTGGGGF